MVHGKVIEREKNSDGSLKGNSNPKSILDSRRYKVDGINLIRVARWICELGRIEVELTPKGEESSPRERARHMN